MKLEEAVDPVIPRTGKLFPEDSVLKAKRLFSMPDIFYLMGDRKYFLDGAEILGIYEIPVLALSGESPYQRKI